MRWAGEGRDWFSVRVDLIAPDDTNRWITPVVESLTARLPFSDGTDRGLIGVDQGRGHEGSPVVGMSFLIRADNFGAAADLAVDTARAAAGDAGVTGRVYDVVIVPGATVVERDGERVIPMPD